MNTLRAISPIDTSTTVPPSPSQSGRTVTNTQAYTE